MNKFALLLTLNIAIKLILGLKYNYENPDTPWNFNSGSQQIWYEDNLWYENYVGKRSYEYDVSFDYNSQYRICSNSKLFTSISILQLIEKGVIKSIHDDINLYLNETDMINWGYPEGTTKWCPYIYPDFNNTICDLGYPMSLASILSMQSGIIAAITCNYDSSQWQYEYCTNYMYVNYYSGSVSGIIKQIASNPLWTAPNATYDVKSLNDLYGEDSYNAYKYSNENFIIASYLVEKLSGLSLREYFQKNIFDVVGLENTYFDQWSQGFQIQSQFTGEYAFYTDLPFDSSTNPDTKSGTYPPFAIGTCGRFEVDQGVQSGSGGIISTLPDMVKWYSSLFITKNTTVINEDSLRLLMYPWAVQNNYPQYFTLGLETMYANAVLKSPSFDDFEYPISTNYMGGSSCVFFSIVMWNSSTNAFGGDEQITYPLISVVARNNRIYNVTEEEWKKTQTNKYGTQQTLSSSWESPGCCAGESSLTDTYTIAFDLLYYFGAMDYEETVIQDTLKPSHKPTHKPSHKPSRKPSHKPSRKPSHKPTK